MTDVLSEKNNFDFAGIYPNCRNSFNSYKYNSRGEPLYSNYSKVCNNFYSSINATVIYQMHFQMYFCIPLGYYLNHIDENKSKSGFNVKANCRYFYYKLRDLVKKCKGNCINEKNCYHILRTPRKNVTLINVPHICNEVVEEMKNIEEDLSHVFYYLDELYGTLDALNGDTNVCNRYNEQCKEYIARLRNCDFSANSSLMSVIDKFEEEYYKICPKPVVPVSIQEPKQKSLIDQRTEKPISGAMIQQINKTSTRSQTMQETTTSAIMDTVTGTGTGVIVVPFIMLAIVFVLFKYSPYGSFLKASVKPLRRMLKKNYINQNDLMNSFEETYKNSVDKKYQIVYSSEYY